MISDSPYDSGELVLKPVAGAMSGLVGGVLMVGLVWALSPVSGLLPSALLARIGGVVASESTTSSGLIVAGLSVHLVIAGLLGLLYALSQRRIPNRGLVGVGLLFGFFVWIISTLFIGWLMDESLRSVLRSWTWLLASLLYGSVLALTSVWLLSRRQMQKQPVLVRD